MSDNAVTLEDLKRQACKFRDERDWKQFHDPRNLAACIAIEAAELQEVFLWKKDQEIDTAIEQDAVFFKKVKEELADVLFASLHLANVLEIDLHDAFEQKLKETEAKYPVEKSYGRAEKYTEL